MPRLPPALVRTAQQSSGHLKSLLTVTRSLDSAHSELRWLTAHARSRATSIRPWQTLLQSYVAHRARHVPLQYILGSEYFGDLEIKCRKGVLIPRQDTASITAHLASLLPSDKPLRILDLCTGTGCIALLLAHLLPPSHVTGVDISPTALALAKENLQLNSPPGPGSVSFVQADILDPSFDPGADFDVVVSNPPYISPRDLRLVTARSVGRYEPRLALAGGESGDVFYGPIVRVAERVGARRVLLEVGDEAQARRVVDMAGEGWQGEVWTEDPAVGEGRVRGVYLIRKHGGEGAGQ